MHSPSAASFSRITLEAHAGNESNTARPERAKRVEGSGYPHRAAGSEGARHHRARPRPRLALLNARLPAVNRERPRRRRRGRRRQPLPRLHRRDRGGLDRPLASGGRQGDHRPGAEVPAHVGDRLLLRAAGAARRADRRHRPDGGTPPVVLQQLGNGAQRGRAEAREVRDRPPQRHPVLRRVSRPVDGVAVADGQQGLAPAGGPAAHGRPLGWTAAPSILMGAWPPGSHASTFGGNPVSCAAALATIRLLRESLVKNAESVGAYLIEGARALMDKHPLIGDVRGRGLMVGIELVRDRRTKERATTERDALVRECFTRGLLVLGAGRNAIRLSPPLVLTRQEADIALRILDEALTATTTARTL